MSEAIPRRCPLCSGDMIPGRRTWHIVFTPPWAKIWGLGPRMRGYPWACTGCGVVLFYLDRTPVLAAEYKKSKSKIAETTAATSTTPLKS
jgi:hypothetical protein